VHIYATGGKSTPHQHPEPTGRRGGLAHTVADDGNNVLTEAGAWADTIKLRGRKYVRSTARVPADSLSGVNRDDAIDWGHGPY